MRVEVDRRTAPEYYGIVERLAQRRRPADAARLRHRQSRSRTRSPQGATRRMRPLRPPPACSSMLSPEEISGVMAHELGHVHNRDTLTMTITATLAGAIAMLGNFAFFFGGGFGGRNNNNPFGIVGVLVAMLVAPLAAMLVQMAISRTREYSADRMGAQFCGNPMWLASALQKIDSAAAQDRQ